MSQVNIQMLVFVIPNPSLLYELTGYMWSPRKAAICMQVHVCADKLRFGPVTAICQIINDEKLYQFRNIKKCAAICQCKMFLGSLSFGVCMNGFRATIINKRYWECMLLCPKLASTYTQKIESLQIISIKKRKK